MSRLEIIHLRSSGEPIDSLCGRIRESLRAVDGEVLGNTQALGWELYRTYLIPFEVVSVLLLVAMIGAIIFGRKDPALEGTGGGMDR